MIFVNDTMITTRGWSRDRGRAVT